MNKVSFKNSSRKRPPERVEGEAFDEGVLNRLAAIDIVPIDPDLLGPAKNGVACEFCPIVADNRLGLAARGDQKIELASGPEARERGVGDGREALPCAVVEDGENPEKPPANELVRDEIQRPAAVRSQGHLASARNRSRKAASSSRRDR